MQVNYNKPLLTLILSVVILVLVVELSKHLVYNVTQSEPIGWYFLSKPNKIQTNKLYTISIPNLTLIKKLGYKANTILKKVVATKGDIITVIKDGVLVNNKLIINSQGIKQYKGILLHPLVVGYSYKLKNGEYFVMGETKNSFDSRYFGVIKQQDIKNQAYLILRS